MATAKAFVSQACGAARASQCATPTLHGVDCSRFWIQGVVASVARDGASCSLDDGTGVLMVDMTTFLRNTPAGLGPSLTTGDLVMVIGPLVRRASQSPSPSPLSPHTEEDTTNVTMIAHQVMPLVDQPQQDSIWFLEVVEYWSGRQ